MKRKLALTLSLCLSLLMIISLPAYAADQQVKIVYLTPETDETSIQVDESIIADFQAQNPGVEVELSHGSLSDLLPKLSAMLTAGTAPDMAFFSPRYVAALEQEGYLLELADLYEKIGDIPSNYITPTGDGKVYDIPAVQESLCLYYRTDLFEAAGLQPPTTWEEWLDCAEKLTQDTDGDGAIDIYGMTMIGGMPDNYYPFSCILWANGAEFFDAENNVAIDSDAAIEALDFAGKLAQFCPPGMTNALTTDVGVMFAQGQTAMVMWPGRIMSLIENHNPELLGKISMVPIPQGPSGSAPVVKASINDFVVFSGTQNPDICKAFIEFYMSDAQYELFLTASAPGHMLPTRTSFLEDTRYLSNETIANKAALVTRSMELAFAHGTDFQYRNNGAFNPNSSEALASTILNQEINRFFLGEITAAEAFQSIANEWRLTFGIQ